MHEDTPTQDSDEIVDNEAAEQALERFFYAFDLDGGWDHLPADDRKARDAAKHTVIRAIRAGRLVFNEDSIPTLHLKYPVNKVETVTFHRPKGSLFTSGDGMRPEDVGAKGHKMLASLTRTNAVLFSKMELTPDLATCQAMMLLFLPAM